MNEKGSERLSSTSCRRHHILWASKGHPKPPRTIPRPQAHAAACFLPVVAGPVSFRPFSRVHSGHHPLHPIRCRIGQDTRPYTTQFHPPTQPHRHV